MRLTKRTVDAQTPSEKDVYVWDDQLSGFGLKTTPAGNKTYLIQYRLGGRHGRTRRMTIGKHGILTTEQARKRAKILLGQIAVGIDPMAERDRVRQSSTVEDMLAKFIAEHVEVNLKPRTQEEYKRVVRRYIPQAIKRRPIEDIVRQDVARLHNEMRDNPHGANKTVALLSKFFNWCEKYGYRPDHTNPCRHIDKYKEKARHRYLSPEEQARLGDALRQAEREELATPYAIAALRLLSLTGARLSEILTLEWDWVDLRRGVLELPDSKTGRKTIYLNEAAKDVIAGIERQLGNPYVICGIKEGARLINLQKPWRRIRKIAGLDDVRIHDLRHTFASVAVMGGMSLPMVGALLGHSQPRTTARYAHLAADPIREAAEQVGQKISLNL